MTKILIGAGDLRDLLAKHPQIEMELLRSAVPQIAEMVRKKAAETELQIDKTVRESFNQLVEEQSRKYGMPAAAREVIRSYLEQIWLVSARALANEAAKAAAREAAAKLIEPEIEKARRQIAEEEEAAMRRVDAYAKEAADREVIALLRAGNLTIKA